MVLHRPVEPAPFIRTWLGRVLTQVTAKGGKGWPSRKRLLTFICAQPLYI